jgi:hypothetical protein
MADNVIGYSNFGQPIINHEGGPRAINSIATFFKKGSRIRVQEMKMLISSSAFNNTDHNVTQNIQSLLCFSSGSPDIVDVWHEKTPPFVPHFHPYIKVLNLDYSTAPYYNTMPTIDDLDYNQKMFNRSSTGSYVSSFTTDFRNTAFGLQQSNVANESTHIHTNSKCFMCNEFNEWWVETRFATVDADQVEFAFGMFEQTPNGTYGATGLHNQAPSNGKDRLIFAKSIHNENAVNVSSSNGTAFTGVSASAFTTPLEYGSNNSQISLGIHWNGPKNEAKFYGSIDGATKTPTPMKLLTTLTDANFPTGPTTTMRLVLYVQGNDTQTDNTNIEYIRAAIRDYGIFKSSL